MLCFGYLGDLGDKNVVFPSGFDAQSTVLCMFHVVCFAKVDVCAQRKGYAIDPSTVLSSFDKDQLEYKKAIEDIAPQWGAPYNRL